MHNIKLATASSLDTKYSTYEYIHIVQYLYVQNRDQEAEASLPSSMMKEEELIKQKVSSSFPEVKNNERKPYYYSDDSYHIAKWMILRLTGLIYFIAFTGAYNQNKALMGENGLVPASSFMDMIRKRYDSNWDGFLHHPTIFWWFDLTDNNMDLVALSGMTISALVIIGEDSVILMFLLWLLDFSIVTIASGTSFYAYGWESQILETGFLAIFLCNLMPQFGRHTQKPAPSPIILWLFRWLSFRISIGAGLIKIRGDSCWTHKTCLFYHFETQPIPSPMSFFFHFLPKWALRHAVDLDLFVQVYTSWFVLVPSSIPGVPTFLNQQVFRRILRLGGTIQAGFMVNILLSGNFAFLNHLTIIPALACLDDECWPEMIRRFVTGTVRPSIEGNRTQFQWKRPRLLVDILLLAFIAKLSWPVIDNLFELSGGRQQMNASFDRFRLVNTYGAFGSVGKGRYEPIISLSYDGKEWVELEFPCKPGTVTRRPCFCAPYHYRLDWNIWFIGFKPHKRMLEGREKWLYELLYKLLHRGESERPWLDVLDESSAALLRQKYSNDQVPKYAKVDMYRYRMSSPLWKLIPKMISSQSEQEVIWWNRKFEEVLIPPFLVNHDEDKFQLAEGL